MFSIKQKAFGSITEYILVNDFTEEYVSVLPAFGAVLNQVALRKGRHVYELLDGCKSYEELLTEGRSKFKGSKLFPFPNRIADGQYTFEDKVYHLAVNFPHEKNSIHGILLERNFTVLNSTVLENSVSLVVQYHTTGEEEGYPFQTSVTIEYRLDKEGFTCLTTIENKDRQNIPVGDGWHPYLKTGSKMDDCILTLPVAQWYEVDSRMIPTGGVVKETRFLEPAKIGANNFDTGYQLIKTEQQNLSTVLKDPARDITIKLWQESGKGKYNYLQIYIPPDRKSIAIEPMSCLADSFNNKEGLIVLKPGENQIFSFGLMLE